MKPSWFIPIAFLIPLHLSATDTQVGARVATITINPREITVLHLRPEFESTIRMPEEVTSVIISDQLEIRDYRLTATRLEAGERADGVVVFERPNFKESTEKLFLQIAQADQVDCPILIRLPFTPPISGNGK
jgi:hypothetical protein